MLLQANRPHGFNTQPPEGGWFSDGLRCMYCDLFQHTAARRRLAYDDVANLVKAVVSTHSRPKAAGSRNINKQRPSLLFQHTAARRRLG